MLCSPLLHVLLPGVLREDFATMSTVAQRTYQCAEEIVLLIVYSAMRSVPTSMSREIVTYQLDLWLLDPRTSDQVPDGFVDTVQWVWMLLIQFGEAGTRLHICYGAGLALRTLTQDTYQDIPVVVHIWALRPLQSLSFLSPSHDLWSVPCACESGSSGRPMEHTCIAPVDGAGQWTQSLHVLIQHTKEQDDGYQDLVHIMELMLGAGAAQFWHAILHAPCYP